MVNVENLIQEYRNETYIATISFYAWRQINNLAVTDRNIYGVLQRNAQSWGIIAHSLQVTFFVALGRLFDRDPRSLTAISFLTRCRAEIKQFSKTGLEARKIKGAKGTRPEWLDEYLRDAYEPTEADFDALIGAADRYSVLYRKTFEPIRHKVFAHKDFDTINSKDELFGKTTIAQAEEILRFLRQVVGVVNALFQNGRMTNLNDHDTDLKNLESEVQTDMETLLRRLIAVQDQS